MSYKTLSLYISICQRQDVPANFSGLIAFNAIFKK